MQQHLWNTQMIWINRRIAAKNIGIFHRLIIEPSFAALGKKKEKLNRGDGTWDFLRFAWKWLQWFLNDQTYCRLSFCRPANKLVISALKWIIQIWASVSTCAMKCVMKPHVLLAISACKSILPYFLQARGWIYQQRKTTDQQGERRDPSMHAHLLPPPPSLRPLSSTPRCCYTTTTTIPPPPTPGNLSKQTNWHLIFFSPTLLYCRLTLLLFLLFPSPPPHCSQVSFLWQATGYQLLGASPAASPPSPSLPSLPHSLSPAAQGPSSRWEIRHHDTNKLSPYFKKAQRGSVCVCVLYESEREYAFERVCMCNAHMHFGASQSVSTGCVCVSISKFIAKCPGSSSPLCVYTHTHLA